jgi:uncharacterized membrane protein
MTEPRTEKQETKISKNLQDNLPSDVEKALESAGVNLHNPDVTRAVSVFMRSYRGTLMFPPAFILTEYKSEFPEIVSKIIEWTEKQTDHRQRLERDDFEADKRRKDRSQIGALAVALTGLLLSALVGTWGNGWVAGVIAIVAMGGPTAAIVLASRMGVETRHEEWERQAPP